MAEYKILGINLTEDEHDYLVSFMRVNQLKRITEFEIQEALKMRSRIETDSFIKDLANMDTDLIDWNSKGDDISKLEFLENEINQVIE